MDGIKQTVMQWKAREKELQSKVLILRRFCFFRYSFLFFFYSTVASFEMLMSLCCLNFISSDLFNS